MVATSSGVTPDNVNALLTIVYIIVSVIVIGGGVSIAGWLKSYRKQVVRDAKLDQLIDPETGVIRKLEEMTKTLQHIDDRGTRNLRDHIDESRAEHSRIWRAINQLQDKAGVRRDP